jgi:D-glycero-D-manno-heptose 1,7-bisphosphate phosphatase
MSQPAVFIDRDGTINEQMGYINDLSRFILLPGAIEGIKCLNQSNFLSIVVSNQSGVARDYFPLDLVHEVNRKMADLLGEKGARIDGIFFCPHHPRAELETYRLDCDCRKPKTGLITQACQAFDIDLPRSFVVGDRYSDIEMGHRLNLRSILVETGYGRGEKKYALPKQKNQPDHIAANLYEAVQWILSRD